MGTRFAPVSITISITRSHSSRVSAGVSPVVPQGTRKSIFDSICHSTRERNAGSSIEPSFLNGVTSAVPQPRSVLMLKRIRNFEEKVLSPRRETPQSQRVRNCRDIVYPSRQHERDNQSLRVADDAQQQRYAKKPTRGPKGK